MADAHHDPQTYRRLVAADPYRHLNVGACLSVVALLKGEVRNVLSSGRAMGFEFSRSRSSSARLHMRPEDVPKGILVITSGKEDKVYEPGWAVSDPELKGIERDNTGKITRYEIAMKLFCKVGSAGANPYFAECSVNAKVCYKASRP